jgi:hypothetical protein
VDSPSHLGRSILITWIGGEVVDTSSEPTPIGVPGAEDLLEKPAA